MRLIDADKLKDIISNTWILDRIDEQPTIDPIKHGYWEHGKELSRDYIGDVCVSVRYDKCWCSECCYQVEECGLPLWTYCPICGAKMDERGKKMGFEQDLIEIRRWCLIYLATGLPFWVLLMLFN